MKLPLAFVCGAVLGVLITLYFTDQTCQSSIQILFHSHLSQEINRANSAYQTAPLAVAEYQLMVLKDTLESEEIRTYETRDAIALMRFMTCARLARLEQELGNQEKYQEFLSAALAEAKQMFPRITNAQSLSSMMATQDHRRIFKGDSAVSH